MLLGCIFIKVIVLSLPFSHTKLYCLVVVCPKMTCLVMVILVHLKKEKLSVVMLKCNGQTVVCWAYNFKCR